FDRQRERYEAIRKRLDTLNQMADGQDEKVVNRVMKDTLSLVGLMSGESSEVVRLPRRVIHAGAAERSRKDTLNAFAYFLRLNPGCRHLVVTCGTPVELHDVRETLRRTCDRIRRLRSYRWFQ